MLVRLAEVLATEEAGSGGKWRGVRGFEDEMFRAVDVRAFRFRVIAPEHKY